MNPTATPELERVRQVGNDVDRAARATRAARRAAVLQARGEGFTLSEIADVLGVSYQRVHQIAQSARSES